jgi:hypothetical protein
MAQIFLCALAPLFLCNEVNPANGLTDDKTESEKILKEQ